MFQLAWKADIAFSEPIPPGARRKAVHHQMRRISWSALWLVRRLWALPLLVAVVLVGLSPLAEGQSTGETPLVLVTPVSGSIGPPTAQHIASVIAEGSERNAELVVLRMDTPGGLTTSTRDINKSILASEVPVAVLVAPAGAQAASAGTYILYASHVAAMAEGTNLGAATPVAMGGGSPLPGGDNDAPQEGDAAPGADEPGDATENQDPVARKRVEDAVASIRALAELRGRNADWAEAAVRDAASLTARAALERGVIEHLASDATGLARAADGQAVTIDGTERRLQTADARIERVAPSLVTRILTVLANPNVALLMMTLGFYGLLYELASPGLGPGVVGGILMLLGLYALNTLPVNYAGVGLILLGLVLLGAEALSPSFGIAGIGGIAAFAIGAAILIDTDVEAFQVSPGVVATLCALSGAVVLLVIGAVLGTRRQSPRESAGAMVGAKAAVISWQDGAGRVRAHGESWRARGPSDLVPGEQVDIAAMDGLTLQLRRDRGAKGKDKR